MGKFYDNTKLLKSLDKNGDPPALYIVCSETRGPGKTFSFAKFLLSNYIEKGEKFILFTRYKKDLGPIAEGVLAEALRINWPGYSVSEVIQMKGSFSNIYINKEEKKELCGYVIPLASCDDIKKISSMFADCSFCFFDEFQPIQASTYLKDEVDLFINIHDSVARGGGSSVRHLPVIMASNALDIYNPYFLRLGLTSKIQPETKFYRGEGVVFEKCDVKGLKEKHEESAFHRAFKKKHEARGWYVEDTSIGKPDEAMTYCATLLYNDMKLGLNYIRSSGCYYVDMKGNPTFFERYNLTINGRINTAFIGSTLLLKMVKERMKLGQVYYANPEVKRIMFETIM